MKHRSHKCRDNPHNIPCDVCKKPVCEDCNRFCGSDHILCTRCVKTTCPRCGPNGSFCGACTQRGQCIKCNITLCGNDWDAFRAMCRTCRPQNEYAEMTKDDKLASDFAAYNKFRKHAKESFRFFKKYDRTAHSFADIIRDSCINHHSTGLRDSLFDTFEDVEERFDDACEELETTVFEKQISAAFLNED